MVKKLTFKAIGWIAANKLLFSIFLLAAIIRFVGTNPSYNQFHSDEGISYSAAVSMIKDADLDPLRYDYPAVVPLSNLIFFKLVFIPLQWSVFWATHIPQVFDGTISLPFNQADYRKIFGDDILSYGMRNALFWGRYVTALFSLGNIILLYLITKKLFTSRLALVATILLIFNFRAVTNAHIGLPDTYNAFFLLLSILASIYLMAKPTRRRYILNGLAMGLSFSTKYQVFAILPFLWSHLQVSIVKHKIKFKKLLNPWFFASFVFFGLVFLMLDPYFFIHLSTALQSVKDVSIKYGIGSKSLEIYPYSYFFNIDYGPIEFVMVLLGLVWLTKDHFKKSILFLSCIVPFFVVMTWYSRGGFYVRNFITVTPLLLIYGAYAIDKISTYLGKTKYLKGKAPIAFGVLLIATIALPARNVLIHDYYYTQGWTYDTILKEAEVALPDNFVIASHPFHTVSKQHPFKRIDFEFATSYSFAEFKEQGAQYAYVDMDLAGNAFYGWMTKTFPDSLNFWNKPTNMFNQTFWGATINEMMPYVVVDAYKPWQAPDAGVFITKIPDLETKVNYKLIKQFSFDNNAENWQTQDSDGLTKPVYSYDKNEGYLSKGSLHSIVVTTDNGIVKISAPAMSVKPSYSYRITGYIKSDQDIAMDKRNGFLRVDFSPGVRGGVSARYDGQGWKKYSFDVLAPNDATLMRLSFQITESAANPFWLDNITVEESTLPVTVPGVKSVPFDEYKDLLYPNSHGNL